MIDLTEEELDYEFEGFQESIVAKLTSPCDDHAILGLVKQLRGAKQFHAALLDTLKSKEFAFSSNRTAATGTTDDLGASV